MASPSPSEISKNSNFLVQETPSKIQSKSSSNSLCKVIIILALLFFTPMFSFQTDLISPGSVLSEIWELIHLLFVGIAVSYGIFGTKTTQVLGNDRNDETTSYFSGILCLSSIFEDEQDWNQNISNLVEDEQANVTKNRSSWRLQSTKGESLVVVSNGKCLVGDFESLNLPLRSLRSNIVNEDEKEFSSKNLEQNLDEGVETCSIPWHSRRHHSVGEYEFDHLDSSSFCSSPDLRNTRSRNLQRIRKWEQPIEGSDSETPNPVKSVRTIKPRKCRMTNEAGWHDRIILENSNAKRGKGYEHEIPRRKDRIRENSFVFDDDLSGESEITKDVMKKKARERSEIYSDAEVDRKAGEFIAKFRKQIRLQKSHGNSTRW